MRVTLYRDHVQMSDSNAVLAVMSVNRFDLSVICVLPMSSGDGIFATEKMIQYDISRISGICKGA